MEGHANRLVGVFPPVVTPFVDERPDLAGLRSNIRRLRDSGVTGFLALGSNAEFRSLSESESEQILQVFEEEKGDAVLMVGAGCESTTLTIANCRRAASHGADYASLITPSYFAKFVTDAVIIRYYTEVADVSPIPVTIYNIPGSTGGVQPSPNAVKKLAEHPNITGMKDSSPAGPGRYLAFLPEDADFHVLSGSLNTFYPSLCLGAHGGVLSLANVLPGKCLELYDLFMNGSYAEAGKLHTRMLRLNQAVSGTHGVAGVKAAMNLAGLRGGLPRLPLSPLSDDETERLASAFREAGFKLS